MSPAPVFLDCFGVLVSANTTREHWRLRLSDWARERWGGERAEWLRAYDLSYDEYGSALDTLHQFESGYSRGFLRREADHLARILAITTRGEGEQPLKLVPEMVRWITEGIDAQFPEVRSTVARLVEMGHPLYVVTDSSTIQLDGILHGTDLEEAFTYRFTGDTTDAGKGTRAFWEKVLEMSGKAGSESYVVDNQPRSLVHPAALGFTTVHLSREVRGGDYVEGQTPDHTITSLFELRGLLGID